MQKSYWKPQGQSSIIMAIAAVLSVFAMGLVELFPSQPSASAIHQKQQAARLAEQAFKTVKAERQKRGIEIDPVTDPTQSGLVGQLMSPVTSNNGHLPAKQASVNPNFAAVIVEMLTQAGVSEGDTVAVGFSGSFPALNISTIAALETLKLKPLIISSASASQWGANHSNFLWIDMESTLQKTGVFSSRSLAASLGGVDDLGTGMSDEALEALRTAITRNKLSLIEPKDFLDGINQRMHLYRQHAGSAPIKAYINVGGGTTSVGTHKGKHQFEPGLNLASPLGTQLVDSVMARFAAENVPVIHLVQINDLALRYGLPTELVVVPQVGEGTVYTPQTYNSWLAAGGLLCIVLILTVPGRLRNPFRRLPHSNLGARQPNKPNGKPRPEHETYACANTPQEKEPIL